MGQLRRNDRREGQNVMRKKHFNLIAVLPVRSRITNYVLRFGARLRRPR